MAANPEHLPLLRAVERAAASLFPEEDLPESQRLDSTPMAELRDAQSVGSLFVAESAGGEPVGFALAGEVDGVAHLLELSVHPEHGRQGLGTRLVEAVERWAKPSFRRITLTTFSHLPWNAPFYQRLGFRVVEPADLTPELAEILRTEARDGLERRVAMGLELT